MRKSEVDFGPSRIWNIEAIYAHLRSIEPRAGISVVRVDLLQSNLSNAP
jgi:hypothetical protein